MYSYYTTIASVAQTPNAEAESNGPSFNATTFVFSIVNVIILFALLTFILFKPVTKLMKERTERIKKNISDSENSKTEADKLKFEYEEQLAKLKEETTTIINNAHQKGQAEADTIIKNAKNDAEIILQRARDEGKREVEKALEEVKDQVTGLALMAASRVIQSNMDTEANRKLVEEFIDEVGAA